MKSKVIVPILATSLWLTCFAAAETSSVVSSARELAKQGLQAYDAGRYDEAAEKLGRAYQVVHVPTLAVNQARALVKVGKWVAASELYLEATRIAPEKSWQSTQRDAQRDAEKERGELLLRIPRLTVVVKGAPTTDVAVTVDGNALPDALLGTEQLQDPGSHRVQGTHGTEVVTESINVKEGDRANVTLQFKLVSASAVQSAQAVPNQTTAITNPAASPPTSPAAPVLATSATSAPAPSNRDHAGNTQRLLGWVGVGLGGAGLVTGGITGLMAMSKRSSLSNSGDCSPDLKHCAPSRSSEVDSYNSLRSLSTIGFFAGGIVAVAGVTLVLTSPKHETGPSMSLLFAPNGVNLTGGF